MKKKEFSLKSRYPYNITHFPKISFHCKQINLILVTFQSLKLHYHLCCILEVWQRNDIKLRECPLQGKFTPFAIELWGIPLNVHCTLSPQITKKNGVEAKSLLDLGQKNTVFYMELERNNSPYFVSHIQLIKFIQIQSYSSILKTTSIYRHLRC